jgi:hypothetical protein
MMRRRSVLVAILFAWVVTLAAAATSDDFGRSDSLTLGANWQQISSSGFDLGVSSNEAYNNDATAAAPSCSRYATGSRTFTGAQYSETTIGTTFSGGQVVFVRASSDTTNATNDFYGFYYEPSTSADIYRNTNGSGTSIVAGGAGFTMPGAPSIGDVLRLEANGSTLTAKWNGTTVATATDSTYSSGQPGFCLWGNFSKVNAWAGDDLGGGGGSTPPNRMLLLGVSELAAELRLSPDVWAPVLWTPRVWAEAGR